MKQQVVLASNNSRIITMVDYKTILKAGTTLKLTDSDEPDIEWTVLKAYLPDRVPARGWHNNI